MCKSCEDKSLYQQEQHQELKLEQSSKIVTRIMLTITILAIIVIGCAIILYLDGFSSLLPRTSDAKNLESLRGQFGAFGDFFGGTLNPLLTFFTIVLLVCSLSLQSQELKASRTELRRTRKSHEQQAQVLSSQLYHSKQQELVHALQKHLDFLREIMNRKCITLPAVFSDDNINSKAIVQAHYKLKRLKKELKLDKAIEEFEQKRTSIAEIHVPFKRDTYQFIFDGDFEGPEVQQLRLLPSLFLSAFNIFDELYEHMLQYSEAQDSEHLNAQDAMNQSMLSMLFSQIEYLCIRETNYFPSRQPKDELLKRYAATQQKLKPKQL
ncbi:hypothetical protein L1D50_18795 [Pseudoalteromonas sp. Isolate6]|uniref:hypothetical protein n=1 Tax=Pseudoalteromonas sp. Isolate6 TaxID=2908527 RepID=UPI001EFD4EFF|nr:hypothetical protein [Pseudoalteromonas sp. Isolate6]MCG9761151.1 hypothetical protein [Pseudoalteromonas sp. Isolate6]